jgi:hypothetical protein
MTTPTESWEKELVSAMEYAQEWHGNTLFYPRELVHDFIRSLLREQEARVLEGFQNYLLKHGYCDADVYAEQTPDGHENAIAGYLATSTGIKE